MDYISAIKDHKILDNACSDKPVFDSEKQYFLDAIESKIAVFNNLPQSEGTINTEKAESDSFVIPFSQIRPSNSNNNYISKSQNWIGHILELKKDEFTAKLIDKNDPSTYEIAQFEIDEVSAGDLSLLKIGALFYWSVGYANENGQIKKQSLIRFKRVADFCVDDFDSIIDDANRLNINLKWD